MFKTKKTIKANASKSTTTAQKQAIIRLIENGVFDSKAKIHDDFRPRIQTTQTFYERANALVFAVCKNIMKTNENASVRMNANIIRGTFKRNERNEVTRQVFDIVAICESKHTYDNDGKKVLAVLSSIQERIEKLCKTYTPSTLATLTK